jgi:hypothetical protein
MTRANLRAKKQVRQINGGRDTLMYLGGSKWGRPFFFFFSGETITSS